jgi:hypothetical protein
MARIDADPPQRPFPQRWQQHLDGPLRGHLVDLRRTTEHGTVQWLGHTFTVAALWPYHLVRCETVLIDTQPLGAAADLGANHWIAQRSQSLAAVLV